MEAIAEIPPLAARTESDAARITEMTLEVLRKALVLPGEHRLFRSGKLDGLFVTRSGLNAEAAREAIANRLLDVVRTEVKGKLIVEWVRIAPAGVALVQAQDSPTVVIAELSAAVTDTRAAVEQLTRRLDGLTDRLEAALRRAESAGPGLRNGLTAVVPWGPNALHYLDLRGTECPLGELFVAVRGSYPDLTVPDFHAGLRRLADHRAVRLAPGDVVPDPEFALMLGSDICSVVSR